MPSQLSEEDGKLRGSESISITSSTLDNTIENKKGGRTKKDKKANAGEKVRKEERGGNQANEGNASGRIEGKSSRKRKHKLSDKSKKVEPPHSEADMNQDSTIIPITERPMSTSNTSNKPTDRAVEQNNVEQSLQEEFHNATIEASKLSYAERLQELAQKHIDEIAGLTRAIEKEIRGLEEEHKGYINAYVNISNENYRNHAEEYKNSTRTNVSTQTEQGIVVTSTCCA